VTFFNKKEEVIEIQLTSYGKYLLSKGVLKPCYYAFFDDDIIYNPEKAGGTVAGDPYPETRIQDNTPSMRGLTTNMDLSRLVKMTQESYNLVPHQSVSSYAASLRSYADMDTITLPIGTGDPANTKSQAWNIKILKGQVVDGSYESHKEDPRSRYTIPTISSSIEYTTNIYTEQDIYGGTSLAERTDAEQNYNETMGVISSPANNNLITYFPDGTVVTVTDNYLVLDIVEENMISDKENFSLEVYEMVPTDSDGDEIADYLKREQLSFIKHPERIVNNILLEDSELEMIDEAKIDKSYVEYYMDITADNEIDDTAVCNYIATTEVERYGWSRVLQCSGLFEDPGSQLYTNETYIGCDEGEV